MKTKLAIFLKGELNRRQRINARYSLRSFAKDLEINPGYLSTIINEGKIPSLKMAIKISKALRLSEDERKSLFAMLGYGDPEQLGLEYYEVLSNWFYIPLMELIECQSTIAPQSTYAQRLNISESEVNNALVILERLGLIKKEKKGYSKVNQHQNIGNNISTQAIRNYHNQMIQKSFEALEIVPINERDYSSLTIALDPELIPEIKEEIKQFKDRLKAISNKAKRQDIYQMNLQFFNFPKINLEVQ